MDINGFAFVFFIVIPIIYTYYYWEYITKTKTKGRVNYFKWYFTRRSRLTLFGSVFITLLGIVSVFWWCIALVFIYIKNIMVKVFTWLIFK